MTPKFQSHCAGMLEGFLLPLVLLACGCNRVDSWGRYESGGDYPSNNFGVDGVGGTLVLSSPVTGHGDIYLFNLATGARKRLTSDVRFEADAIISRDGSKVVFSREQSGHGSLWLHDIASGAEKRLTSGSFYDMPWDFSADGRHIMAFRTPASSKTGNCVIISSDPENHTEIDVPRFARFAPDSSRYCYSSYDARQQRSIMRVGNLQDRGEYELGYGSIPEWSPDGAQILYATENGEERALIPAEGGKSTPIGMLPLATFSEDGSGIFYTDETRREVWKRSVRTGEQDLVAGTDALIQRLVSTRIGPICLALRNGERVGVILKIDVDNQKSVPLIDIAESRWLR